ncbi:MAG: acetyl-CoA decarbonylase/synthase complex subunit gamma [Chloroflexi bacterium]|nr:acetyl-CoA decarbonylase/synthase complex subunit gamma [Chloroflexota bacterium]MBK7916998.1 acetyl-CoA decarbonylase/synthase complex subunit gamma [Chloroflexota bacterium]MBP6473526.1 acetyl-CoA decarbonylase/synthase complex subunit gamma [Chloroflexota bacterium]MBP7591242.1 acetyl-CoA decarbonylase/synthase complex subunit gamma [Chloroflexota bacterium]
MALSGIQIYKMLPQTNCKECGFPTCLAFAMKLAQKQVELALCPTVSEESKAQLSEAAAPPVRPITLKSNGYEVLSGNEVVLFRHEKRFFSPAGLFVRVYDDEALDVIRQKVTAVADYVVDYVGIDLRLDGLAVQAAGGDFVGAVTAVRAITHLPLILIGQPDMLKTAIDKLDDGKLLLAHATADNWQAMAALAKSANAALAVQAATVDDMVDLAEKVKTAGVDDIVLAPAQRSLGGTLVANTTARRMALKKSFRNLGYPILNLPGDSENPDLEILLAAQAIGKYGGFVVLDHFSPETAYSLLVLRQNIYTDPQKPIQVQPDIYEINNPGPDSPVLVTTNFSITYFSVANEVESAGLPAWLLVCDAEGMSVLTAWAAGKFDAERIAKDVKRFGVSEKVANKRLVLPGHVAILSGELEEELPGWDIKVGPREAVDLPAFMKQVLG